MSPEILYVPVLLNLHGLLDLVRDKSLALEGGWVLWRGAVFAQAQPGALQGLWGVVRQLWEAVRGAPDGLCLGSQVTPLQRYLHVMLAERPHMAALQLHQIGLLVEGPIVQELLFVELPDRARGGPVRGQILRVHLGLLVGRQLLAVQLDELITTFGVVFSLVLLTLRLLPRRELRERRVLLGETLQGGSGAPAHVTSAAGPTVAPAASTQGLLLDG